MDSGNVSLPFIDNQFPSFILRTFHKDVPEDSLSWHKDEFDRNVKVISGFGWKLQMDNNIPIDLSPGDTLKIPKNIFHRIIKSKHNESSLVLKICERK